VAVFFVALVVLAQTPVTAQEASASGAQSGSAADEPTSPTVASRAAAQVEFAAGREAFDRGDFDTALVRLRTAEELAPHDVVRFNIALCLEQLDHIVEAVQVLAGLRDSEQLGPDERERARARYDVLLRQLGRLEAPQAGARLRVEGGARCDGPCELLVAPGPHRVWVELDGTEEVRRVVVQAGEAERLTVAAPANGAAVANVAAHAPTTPSRGFALTPLGGVGAVVAAIGLAGVVGFGIHTWSLHEAYEAGSGTAANGVLREEGLLFRDLTNASLAVGVAGLLVLAIDVVWGLLRIDDR
jgi:hypothetical protein